MTNNNLKNSSALFYVAIWIIAPFLAIIAQIGWTIFTALQELHWDTTTNTLCQLDTIVRCTPQEYILGEVMYQLIVVNLFEFGLPTIAWTAVFWVIALLTRFIIRKLKQPTVPV
jgi:hypothetical protein